MTCTIYILTPNVLKKELYALVIIENFRESFKGGNMRMESNNVVEVGGGENVIE